MQHDVFANPGPRTRLTRPFLAVLKADSVDGPSRLVCPLFRLEYLPVGKATPAVRILSDTFVLAVEAMFAMPRRELRRPVANIAAYRDDIVRALDWLFTGL